MKHDKKVIIWGYPLFSHTHSYVHESYVKAFKYLGYETYWFHDNEYPKDFDFSNSIFVTEGFADKNIPLNNSSVYFVMYCPSPKKYIEANVKKYIDLRMCASNHKDHVQEYSLDKNIANYISPGCYYEPAKIGKIRIKNDYVDYEIEDFDKFYMFWATNLLPYEFDENDIYVQREKLVLYLGTISGTGICENLSNFAPFINECLKSGIKFIHNDPWVNPVSSENLRELMKKSLIGIDIRGPEHIRTGIVTCRIFKNISYGHLGMTNSTTIQEAVDGNCVYNNNTADLFHDGIKNIRNYKLIKSAMNYVKENHTYINRIQSMLKVI